MTDKTHIINDLVTEQVIQIVDPLVKSAFEKIQITPALHFREWDYSASNEKFECWTVAIDESSDTSIVYSESGFGPKNPWGLVFTSTLNFGMDSGWFDNLIDCFLESFIAGELPIWIVEKHIESNKRELIAENLTSDEAFNLINTLTKHNKEYYIVVRKPDFA